MTTALDELSEVLRAISELAAEGKAVFEADRKQRWSIERLWIFAGNAAERYCRERDIDSGIDPWAELIAIRNVFAHYTPRAISYERVWADTVADVDRIRNAVNSSRSDRGRTHPPMT